MQVEGFVLFSQCIWRWVVWKWNPFSLFWKVYIWRTDCIRMLPQDRGMTKKTRVYPIDFSTPDFCLIYGYQSVGIIYERFEFVKAQNNKRQGFVQKVLFSLQNPRYRLYSFWKAWTWTKKFRGRFRRTHPCYQKSQNRISWMWPFSEIVGRRRNNH